MISFILMVYVLVSNRGNHERNLAFTIENFVHLLAGSLWIDFCVVARAFNAGWLGPFLVCDSTKFNAVFNWTCFSGTSKVRPAIRPTTNGSPWKSARLLSRRLFESVWVAANCNALFWNTVATKSFIAAMRLYSLLLAPNLMLEAKNKLRTKWDFWSLFILWLKPWISGPEVFARYVT